MLDATEIISTQEQMDQHSRGRTIAFIVYVALVAAMLAMTPTMKCQNTATDLCKSYSGVASDNTGPP